MSSPREKEFNPFYTLVVVVGVAFVLTAAPYWLHTLTRTAHFRSSMQHADRAERHIPAEPSTQEQTRRWDLGLVRLTPVELLLGIELIVLVVCATLAMGLDHRRFANQKRTSTATRSDHT